MIFIILKGSSMFILPALFLILAHWPAGIDRKSLAGAEGIVPGAAYRALDQLTMRKDQ